MSVGLDRLWWTCEAIWKRQQDVTESSIKEHPQPPPRLRPPLTFACRAICRATKDRLRSDTILATLVSTRPSMSVETHCSYLTQAKTATPAPSLGLTFPALQGQ